ncbi:MAG TPA: APC family permease [Solirubrobacterales bacterium]|nr:APC family permease [Solirubrobacterales bacterium]
MQNIANIAPAIAALFTLPAIVGFSGQTAPLAYLLAFFITLSSGYVLAQFTHHLPSGGSYFTFLSRSLNPRIGFLATWLYFFAFPLVGAQAGDAFGSTIEQTLEGQYGFSFPWWGFLLIGLSITAAVSIPGIKFGIRTLAVMSVIELVIVVALAFSGLIDPGPGGFSLGGFNPSEAPALGTFYLGITFAIFALTGWDSAAPLAEESKSPRKSVGRGIILSILIMGAVLVFVSWGVTVGWGVDNLDTLIDAEENPGFILGREVWGGAWLLVLFALVNSVFAVLISSMNASTRMWYRMSKVGALPKFMGEVHPRFQTPVNAIWFQTGLSVVLGLALGVIFGVENVFSVLGFLFIFAVLPAWILANLGVFLFYKREHPDEFHWFKHAVVPLVSTIGLGWVGYKSIFPLPPSPEGYAVPIVGIWLLIGVAILVYMHYRGDEEQFLERAGMAVDESSEGADAAR